MVNKAGKTKTAPLIAKNVLGALQKLAASAGTHARHAQALLSVQAGATQAQAALQSGLSIGQVRYWVSKYRQQGLAALLPAESEAKPVKLGKANKAGKSDEKAAKFKKKKADKKSNNKKSNGKKSKKSGKKSKKGKKKK